MKKAGIIATALICVALVVGGFFIIKEKAAQERNKEVQLTEVQKVITKDLDKKYPSTPREVVKLYNRIITCYYHEPYTESELSQLADQALRLFDADLQAINPKDQYLGAVKKEVLEYRDRDRYIAQTEVCSSDKVLFKTIDGDEIAYVTSSYFVREGTGYGKTFQQYVLRKNEDGEWRILVFYQVDATSLDEE